MTEPTPPPERSLPEESRARIRSDLLAHAQEHRSATPRWVVPAGAAAAVALVAGLSYWAISPGSSDRSGLPVTGGGASSATPTATAEPTSAPSTVEPTSLSSSRGTATLAPPGADGTAGVVEVGTRSCEEEMEFVLKGAELAVQVDENDSFYVKGDRFVLCDTLGGMTTVHRSLPLTPRDDVSTYAVSSVYDGKRTIRVAGGVVPPGSEEVLDVAYTFPDGHTERATKATDDQGRTWWLMVYAYDDGGGNEMEKPPITVTMSLSGVQRSYILEWGTDTCAQANHGC